MFLSEVTGRDSFEWQDMLSLFAGKRRCTNDYQIQIQTLLVVSVEVDRL